MGVHQRHLTSKHSKYEGRLPNKFKTGKLSRMGVVPDAGSDSDSGPEEESFFESESKGNGKGKSNKHAPKETKNIHRPVSVVREIPGLVIPDKYRDNSINNGDIRFDTALGRSIDYEVVRKQYSFLDEYREKEICEMEKVLKNKKMMSKLSSNEVEEIKYKLQSTKSKLESLKKKDREKNAIKSYVKENKDSKKFLTRAEKRKVILVDRFENMNSKQKNKSIERKRKRKLGKEMRALEFSR